MNSIKLEILSPLETQHNWFHLVLIHRLLGILQAEHPQKSLVHMQSGWRIERSLQNRQELSQSVSSVSFEKVFLGKHERRE